MLKLVLAPFIAYNRLGLFSRGTALAGQCWLSIQPTQRTQLELTLIITALIMALQASLCNLARCLMPPCSYSPAPTLGRAPRGTVTPAAMVLWMISPILQSVLVTTKELELEPESPLSSSAVRMYTQSKAPMSTETTLGQRQWPL